jgi:hypothetical protein
MKIIVTKVFTKFEPHFEVQVKDGCLLLHSYVFDTKREVEAFCSGFSCAKSIANSQVQSLPMGYEMVNK